MDVEHILILICQSRNLYWPQDNIYAVTTNVRQFVMCIDGSVFAVPLLLSLYGRRPREVGDKGASNPCIKTKPNADHKRPEMNLRLADHAGCRSSFLLWKWNEDGPNNTRRIEGKEEQSEDIKKKISPGEEGSHQPKQKAEHVAQKPKVSSCSRLSKHNSRNRDVVKKIVAGTSFVHLPLQRAVAKSDIKRGCVNYIQI